MTLFSGIEAVLFDLDGTLVDSAPDLAHAADAMRVKRGLPSLPFEDYRCMAGAGARGLLGVAFGLTPEHPDYLSLREEFFDLYQTCLTERTRPFEAVDVMVGALERAGLHWGVVTNKIERFALPLTAQLPLFQRAATVVAGDTAAHPKPHPAPLLEAAKRLGLAPERCIYVGDDERDIVAGKAAGMRTVAAVYGYLVPDGDVAAWGADAIIKNPLELLNFLELA